MCFVNPPILPETGRKLILVVGKNSFIAREFLSRTDPKMVRSVCHHEIRPDIFKGITSVINFSYAPDMHHHPYQEDLDVDLKLAREILDNQDTHYLMISSRRVYNKTSQWNSKENQPADGLDNYGRNKLCSEQKLTELLGARLTILRPGNVFGYEVEPTRQRFGTYLLRQLADEGCIRLTVSPFVRRDIVPVDYFCEVLHAVIARRTPGVLNVGSGLATEIGRIALWLIEGFGKGRLIVDNPAVVDEFQLDIRRLRDELGFSCNSERIANFTRNLGRRLSKELVR